MSSSPQDAAIALTRFGLGARPGEIATVAPDPRGWLTGQIRPAGAPVPAGEFETTEERVESWHAYQAEARDARQVRRESGQPAMQPASMPTQAEENPQARAAFDARRRSRRNLVQDTAQEFLARAKLGATTEAGFAERWALFWANAFTASATRFQTAVFIGQYEREAIRPHVFGRFEDLALAAERHPAMLLYLDQAQSVGPNSMAGERRQAGLNENLAREILELHTVGSDGGYTQADVTEFARALTGWSVPNARELGGGARPRRAARRMAPAMPEDGFIFRAAIHEPGERTVLGRTYAQAGAAQGEAILTDLANRPETARRLSRRIAQHFVSDDPPERLVGRLEAAWTGSRGDLSAVARALVQAPESWAPAATKVKTPYEFIVSSHRAFGRQPERPQPLQQALIQMGQPAFAAPSPEGWPDTAADWAGPDALVKRLNWAKAAGDMASDVDAVALADAALGERLTPRTRQFVSRAESRAEAITLFLMSPEFQRR